MGTLHWATENDGNRRGRRSDCAGRCEPAGIPISAERHDIVRVLVGYQQPHTGRVEAEVAGVLTLCRLVPDQLHLAALAGNPPDRDTVVPAIRPVDEPAVWSYDDVRA